MSLFLRSLTSRRRDSFPSAARWQLIVQAGLSCATCQVDPFLLMIATFLGNQRRVRWDGMKPSDVQVECAKLAEENAKLRQELLDLREQAKTRREMYYENNVYWRQTADGKPDGPFCPKCLDGNHKAARMSDYSDWHTWTCPVCECSIQKPGGRREIRVETDYDPFSSRQAGRCFTPWNRLVAILCGDVHTKQRDRESFLIVQPESLS